MLRNGREQLKWMSLPLILFAGTFVFAGKLQRLHIPKDKQDARKIVSNLISDDIQNSNFPKFVLLDKNDRSSARYKVSYTISPDLQSHADSLLKKYKPEYAAIVMLNAKTGEILAMTSYERNPKINSNLALLSTFPAASIFKTITASAAVDRAGVNPEHQIAFNGGNYTLYKKNVLSDKITKWTRFITLKEAFAKSINTAFGRLSLEKLKPRDLSNYASRFHFNKEIYSDFEVERSSAQVPKQKGFELTEVASGYNRFNKISPIHGAMIASTFINDGKMPMPYVVRNILNDQNDVIYTGSPLIKPQIIKQSSANKMKELMEQTVLTGTSRKSFKNIVNDKKFRDVEMGGKTGHITSSSPKGLTDWFVGYASDGEDKIAIAAVSINSQGSPVKSAVLSEMMFRRYFTPKN